MRVCATLLMAANDECRLWYVPPDIITFSHKLEMGMVVPLDARANVRKVFEMLDFIQST